MEHCIRLSSAIFLPGIWLTDTDLRTHKEGTVFHLVVLWCRQLPQTKARRCLVRHIRTPELLLAQPCWDDKGHNIRPSFRSNCCAENKECSLTFAGVPSFGRSSSSFWGGILLPCILVWWCSLEGKEVYPLQQIHFILLTLIPSAFLLYLRVLVRLGPSNLS